MDWNNLQGHGLKDSTRYVKGQGYLQGQSDHSFHKKIQYRKDTYTDCLCWRHNINKRWFKRNGHIEEKTGKRIRDERSKTSKSTLLECWTKCCQYFWDKNLAKCWKQHKLTSTRSMPPDSVKSHSSNNMPFLSLELYPYISQVIDWNKKWKEKSFSYPLDMNHS